MASWRAWRAGALLASCLLAGLAQAAPEVGKPSPVDLLGKTPDGEEVRISAHRGKAMVVSFWASWCGYCRKQFPLLDYLQSHVGSEHLRVVVVNFKEPVADYRSVRRALRESVVTWTHDRDGVLSEAFGVEAVPRTFIFDRSGRLVAVRKGYSEEGAARTIEILNEVLAEPAPADEVPEAPPVAMADGDSR